MNNVVVYSVFLTFQAITNINMKKTCCIHTSNIPLLGYQHFGLNDCHLICCSYLILINYNYLVFIVQL